MKSFRKLGREEMRQITGGGNNGCPGGGCFPKENCSVAGSGCVAGGTQPGTCSVCTCPGAGGVLQCVPTQNPVV